MSDTIAAIATPGQPSAIGILRLSGPDTCAALDAVFRAQNGRPAAQQCPRAMVLGIMKRIDFGGIDMTANNIKNKSYSFPSYDTMPACMQEHLDKGELGLKSGKGFYDYTGKDTSEITAHRDKQLFEVFALAKKFMADPV